MASVTPGGPAEIAKIEPGDVILEFDGKTIDRMRGLPRIVAETPIGKAVEVTVWRRGEKKIVEVTPGRAAGGGGAGGADRERGRHPDLGRHRGARRDRRDPHRGAADALRAGPEDQGRGDRRGGRGRLGRRGEPAPRRRDRRGRARKRSTRRPRSPPRSTRPSQDDKKSVLLLIDRQGDLRFVALRLAEARPSSRAAAPAAPEALRARRRRLSRRRSRAGAMPCRIEQRGQVADADRDRRGGPDHRMSAKGDAQPGRVAASADRWRRRRPPASRPAAAGAPGRGAGAARACSGPRAPARAPGRSAGRR